MSTAASAQRLKTIAVIGDGNISDTGPHWALASQCGRGIVDRGHALLTGGLGGVMEAACRGGRSSASWVAGRIVGVLPGHDPTGANPFVDIALPTGLDAGRNLLVAQADAVVAIGGGAGTLSELALAWQFRRLIVALRVDGWSGRLADSPIDHRVRQPDVADDRIYGAETAEEALALIDELLPRYEGRHRGVRRR